MWDFHQNAHSFQSNSAVTQFQKTIMWSMSTSFEPWRMSLNTFVSKKIWAKKNLGQQKFGVKKILGQKNFESKKNLGKKN